MTQFDDAAEAGAGTSAAAPGSQAPATTAELANLPPRFLPSGGLTALFAELTKRGYTTVGPRIDQGAIVYGELHSPDDLPRGWTDRQEAGHYRLERRADEHSFGFVVGPQSWKQYLFPPQAAVATATRTDQGWQLSGHQGLDAPQYAFLGVRACELAAIRVQDRVFLESHYVDPIYAARRRQALIIAVNCTQAAPTCFCTSQQTGPRCTSGFDLALTELDEGYVVDTGSPRGQELLASLPTTLATAEQLQTAEHQRRRAVEQQVRQLPEPQQVRQLLLSNLRHAHWEQVAQRCLSCTNCTQVCPTCFCSSVQEVTDLDWHRVERHRVWDSCFNPDFSYMNGGQVRNSIPSRYRQWLVHKLATWHDQFGQSGCVGCGRCITWCPVGIDLTAEVAALAQQVGVGPTPDTALQRASSGAADSSAASTPGAGESQP